MKKFITIILFFQLSISAYSQYTFERIIEDYPYYFHPFDAIEEDNGNIIITIMKDSAFAGNAKTYLLKINEQGEILLEKEILPEKKSTIRDIIKTDDGNYIAIGELKSDTSENYNIWFFKFNSNLDTLWQKQYAPINGITPSMVNSIITYSGDIVAAGFSYDTTNGNQKIFMLKLSQEGNILLTKHITTMYNDALDVVQKKDASGFIICNSGNDLIFLNNSFNITTTKEIIRDNNGYEFYMGWSNVRWLTNSKLLYTALLLIDNNGNADNGTLGISLLNSSYNTLYENKFGKTDTVEYPAQHINIDFINPNDIYLGGTSNISMGDNPFLPLTHSWYMLNKMDSSLNLKWQKFYGGDAAYTLQNVIATADGGCLMLGKRYDYPTQYSDNSLHILKVNELGEITNIPENAGISAHNAILYPNPSTTKINIMVVENYKNSTINITDISGKQIISEQIQGTSTQIDISEFQSGIYFYTILNNNEVIEGGKFVKE